MLSRSVRVSPGPNSDRGTLTWRHERVDIVRKDRKMRGFVNHIDAQPVSGFHQHVEVVSTRVHFDPARMIALRWRIDTTDQGECAVGGFLVCPDLVCPHVGRVEIRFGRVKDHAMNRRLLTVLVILDVLVQFAVLVDGEDVAKACVLVERVSVNTIRRLFSC